MLRLSPRPTLFPYTTLFRSLRNGYPVAQPLPVGLRADRKALQQPVGDFTVIRRRVAIPVAGNQFDKPVPLGSRGLALPQLGQGGKRTRRKFSHVEISYAGVC